MAYSVVEAFYLYLCSALRLWYNAHAKSQRLNDMPSEPDLDNKLWSATDTFFFIFLFFYLMIICLRSYLRHRLYSLNFMSLLKSPDSCITLTTLISGTARAMESSMSLSLSIFVTTIIAFIKL